MCGAKHLNVTMQAVTGGGEEADVTPPAARAFEK